MYYIGLGLCALFIEARAHAGECEWARVKVPGQMDARVELSVSSALDVTGEAEVSRGRFLMIGSSAFVWTVTKDDQVYLYHGDGDTLRYYSGKSLNSPEVQRSQKLSETWMGVFADVIFHPGRIQGRESHTLFHTQSKSRGPRKCVSEWKMKKDDTGERLPPFVAMLMTWEKGSPPKLHSLTLEEHVGTVYQIKFESLQWAVDYSLKQLLDPEFVLSRFTQQSVKP